MKILLAVIVLLTTALLATVGFIWYLHATTEVTR